MWIQKELTLKPVSRGFHLITDQIESALPEHRQIKIGLLHIFLQHTSAALLLNENADPTVRKDLEKFISTLVPENYPYTHTAEGPEDMPAHIKSALLGQSLTLPVQSGHFALGTWQGITLAEHRSDRPIRSLLLTLQGE